MKHMFSVTGKRIKVKCRPGCRNALTIMSSALQVYKTINARQSVKAKGGWCFAVSGYRWNRSRIKLLRNLWAGAGGPYPDASTSRSVAQIRPLPDSPQLSSASDPAAGSLSAPPGAWALQTQCPLPALIYSPSTEPFRREQPPRPPRGFYSKHMLQMFEVPTIHGFSFFFSFFFS